MFTLSCASLPLLVPLSLFRLIKLSFSLDIDHSSLLTMGQPESVPLASQTTMFVPPLANRNRMLLSSQTSHLIQLQVAAAVEAVAIVPSSSSSTTETPSLQHYNAGAGAENNDPNQTANLKSSLELTNTDGVVALASVIPNGFAVVDNEMFEGKKIIATRTFKKGELLYVGQARMLDLSAIGHGFKLKIYSEDCELLSEHCNNDTHSVDDYAAASKTGSESKRQVYGWDGFMNHSCDANAYFRKLSFELEKEHDHYYFMLSNSFLCLL